MKQFSAQTGGRYTYADDVMNLQDLALAINHIFDGCDNFVVSGCVVSGSSISSGYVFINGEFRKFDGKSNISSWPQYICENNFTENVSYASGTVKVGRTVYGCKVSASIPTEADPVTGVAPKYIKFTKTGGVHMREAFFGKYALLLESANGPQNINGAVTFANGVTVNGLLTGTRGAAFNSGNNKAEFGWDSSDFSIKTTVGSKTYKFAMTNADGFKFFVDDVAVLAVSSTGITTNLQFNTSGGLISGDVALIGSDFYNRGNQTDNGALNINMLGSNGGASFYRNTVIGNGKGKAVLSVIGSTGKVNVDGSMTITGSITHATAVNLGPAIKENGELLSDKYYTKVNAKNDFPLKSNLLSDMITTDAQKKTVRDLLNVYSKDEVEPKQYDSGWVDFYIDTVCGINIKARQVGRIVLLQGTITATTAFPGSWSHQGYVSSNLGKPDYEATVSVGSGAFVVKPDGEIRTLKVWERGTYPIYAIYICK